MSGSPPKHQLVPTIRCRLDKRVAICYYRYIQALLDTQKDKRRVEMKTTIARLEGSLSAAEMKDFVEFGGCQSKAFGTVEVLRRYEDGSIEVSGNLFLRDALSLGFRPEKIQDYGEGARSGIIWMVSPDSLYVSDNGDGSWWESSSDLDDVAIDLVRQFLEADDDDVAGLQEQLDNLGISYS